MSNSKKTTEEVAAKPTEEGAAKPTKEVQQNALLEQIGKNVIADWSLDEVWVTSDGSVFATLNDAENNAKSLADKIIIHVK